jgi:hypothetical protein
MEPVRLELALSVSNDALVLRHVPFVQLNRLDVEQPRPVGLIAEDLLERLACILLAQKQVDRFRVAEPDQGECAHARSLRRPRRTARWGGRLRPTSGRAPYGVLVVVVGA